MVTWRCQLGGKAKPIRAVPSFSFMYIMKQHLKFILLFICLLTTININAISDSSTKSKELIIENTNSDDNNSYYFNIRTSARIESTTASSIHVIGLCEYETNIQDEVILSHTIALYKDMYNDANLIAQIDSQECNFTGLEPNTLYWTKYTLIVISHGNEKYGHTRPVYTQELTLTTSQPQVISNGNVILSAETNIDDAETNIGFEWRRTDWTDDFASNTGEATLSNGIMEGHIFNLNTEKLWKYRPYYISNSG